MTGAVRVLARVDAAGFLTRPEGEREEVRAWLRANGVDPCVVPCGAGAWDVQVLLLDAPVIARVELVPGGPRRHPVTGLLWTRVVHSLLRVPLPVHLADPA